MIGGITDVVKTLDVNQMEILDLNKHYDITPYNANTSNVAPAQNPHHISGQRRRRSQRKALALFSVTDSFPFAFHHFSSLFSSSPLLINCHHFFITVHHLSSLIITFDHFA